MQNPSPFILRGARYDEFGNVILLPWEEDLQLNDEEGVGECSENLSGQNVVQASEGSKLLGSGEKTLEKKERIRKREKTVSSWRIHDESRRVSRRMNSPASATVQYTHSVVESKNVNDAEKDAVHTRTSTRKRRLIGQHSPRALRYLIESGRFGVTFVSVFLFLFVSLNFSTFSRIFQAHLFPESGAEERIALTAMTSPRPLSSLLSVPELPRAGSDASGLIAALAVTPPDMRLIIPKLNINVPLVSATDAALRRRDWKTFEKDIQDALRFGVVHYPGTARPGELGNVFMTGHSSNYPWVKSDYNAVFALLPDLETGDEYSIYSEGILHRYRIAEKLEVSPKDVSVLDQPTDRYMSTLMTCTPVGTTLKRLILRAEEIDPATSEVISEREESPAASEVQWDGELAV